MSSSLSSLTLPKLGNTSPSALIKSAATLSNELATYNDTAQRIAFENNPGDAQLNVYLKYLKGRVGALNASGSVTDVTKALTMSQEMHTAISSNTSFNIQNESIRVLAGTGSDQEKLNYISNAFSRAQGIGDIKLAQSLESQAYNLQQSIEYHAQTAASAAQSLQSALNSQITENATAQNNVADNLKNSLAMLNAEIKQDGMESFNTISKQWVKSQAATFKALGVKIPGGAQPSYGDIVAGVSQAMYSAHILAGNMELPVSPAGAQSHYNEANDILNGTTSLETLAGGLNVSQIQDLQNNPNRYLWNVSTKSFDKTAQTGYQYATGPNGQPLMVKNAAGKLVRQVGGQYSTSIAGGIQADGTVYGQTANKDEVQELKSLGLTVTNTSGKLTSGYHVQATNQTPKWLLKALGIKSGTPFSVFSTGHGFQVGTNDKNGSPLLYEITTDNKGLHGIYSISNTLNATPIKNAKGDIVGYENNTSHQDVQLSHSTTQLGLKALGGDYGFNQQVNKLISNTTKQKVLANIAMAQRSKAMGIQLHTQPRAVGIAPNRRPMMVQRAGGGYNFTNASGQAISAATYAQLTGTPFRTLLSNMAAHGDAGAKATLGFVGNDFGYDPTKLNKGNINTYNAMVWGASGVKQASLPNAQQSIFKAPSAYAFPHL